MSRAIRIALLALTLCTTASAENIRVMSFNIWVGGEGSFMPLERTADVIRTARADVVGLQEGYARERYGIRPDNAARLAKLLGWNHADQGNGKAVLSRFPIEGLTPGRQGALVRLPSGHPLYVFNVHLNHAPYQPYQLLKIDYADAPFLDTEAQLIEAAQQARGAEIAAALAEMKPLLLEGKAAVLTGDFNEPSHLDWTPRAVAAGIAPMPVAYPASQQVAQLGLIDTYRKCHPDETTHPGFTWTPTTRRDDPKDKHDRIDFVYAAPSLAIKRCEVVGESPENADLHLHPYPSDHRAVVTELALKP